MSDKTKTGNHWMTAIQNRIDLLEKNNSVLKECIAKMAHYNGNEAILRQFGIEPWKPDKSDMTRWSDGG